MGFTHIILTQGKKQEVLCRVSDGIVIGQRKGFTVVYGEAPNKKDSRVFIDDIHASRYLRGFVALADLKAQGLEGPVVIEDREMSPIIELSEDTDIMEMNRPSLVKFN